MNLFFDLETTSLLHNGAAEIIEGYFVKTDSKFNIIEDYELKVRPEKWESQSESVHSISYFTACDYASKPDALASLHDWLPNRPDIYIYVNPVGNIWFDMACLRLLYFDCNRLYDYYTKFANSKLYTVRDTVLSAFTNGAITLPKKRMKYDMRLETAYKHTFGEEFKAHNAKEDTLATLRLQKHLYKNSSWI